MSKSAIQLAVLLETIPVRCRYYADETISGECMRTKRFPYDENGEYAPKEDPEAFIGPRYTCCDGEIQYCTLTEEEFRGFKG